MTSSKKSIYIQFCTCCHSVSLWAQSRDVSKLRVSLRSSEKQWRSCRGFAAAFFVLPDEAILMAFWVSATACANTYKMTQKSNKNKLYLPSFMKSANSIYCVRCWGSHFPKLAAFCQLRGQIKGTKLYTVNNTHVLYWCSSHTKQWESRHKKSELE